MIDVVGIDYDNSNKIHYLVINNLNISKCDKLILSTERGLEFACAKTDILKIKAEKLKNSNAEIVRKATKEDIEQFKKNLEDEDQAFVKACDLVEELGLKMKILNVSYTFDRKQLLFEFISDSRIDFRELAKKLAHIYKTRIELRQIGVRDKAKAVGGYGLCGRPLCCASFLDNINSVSINMAKNQNLALNPQKINGVCGRLLCCLSYEDSMYSEMKKNLPKTGAKVKTKAGDGVVTAVDVLNESYTVLVNGKKIDITKED